MHYRELGFENTKDMFSKAYKGGYAVPAYNFINMEQLQAIVTACIKSRSPVILQASKRVRQYVGREFMKSLSRAAIELIRQSDTPIPCALHLDHGDSPEECKNSINDGFSSVMIDGSALPFDENIRVTKNVVDYAHEYDVTVEGELGVLSGVEDDITHERTKYTDPLSVKEFVAKTGVDSLAVSIGTAHGVTKARLKPGEPMPPLRFDILNEIENKVPGFPIVLHGSSSIPQEYIDMVNKYGGDIKEAVGIPEDQIRKASRSSVCKVNIATDALLVMTAIIRKTMYEYATVFDPRKYIGPARDELVKMYMKKNKEVLGSSHKA
jgi:fructose-bisphosphate aldolase class II